MNCVQHGINASRWKPFMLLPAALRRLPVTKDSHEEGSRGTPGVAKCLFISSTECFWGEKKKRLCKQVCVNFWRHGVGTCIDTGQQDKTSSSALQTAIKTSLDHTLIDAMPPQTTQHCYSYISHITQGKNTRQRKQHRVTRHTAYHSSSAKLLSSISDLWLVGEVENS